MNRAGVVALVGLALVVGACDDSRVWYGPPDTPMDIREYHGDPSSIVCGQRWSHDHHSFLCERHAMSVEQLGRFWQLRSVDFAEMRLRRGNGPPIRTVDDLGLTSVKLADVDLAESFPKLATLDVNDADIDLSSLARSSTLKRLTLARVHPPDAEMLASVPKLEKVSFIWLRCDQPGCDKKLAQRLHELRPQLAIEIDGAAYPLILHRGAVD